MFFGGGPFLLHIFTQLKLAMYVGITASAQTVPYAPAGSTGFGRTYCFAQLRKVTVFVT